MSKGFKKPQYKPIELNMNIVYGITSVDNITQAESDSIQWLCEAYEHQNKQIADLEGHIKGLTKVRNYEKCKHIRKRKRLQQQIADLEAKLAESEERINWLVEAEFNRKWAKKYVEMRRKEDPMLCLPDSDEVYEKYFELKQQLADKEKEIKKLTLLYFGDENTETILTTNKMIQHIKISFAVEQLEKVKEKALHFYVNDTPKLTGHYVDINEIDNQIKQLTHQREDKGE